MSSRDAPVLAVARTCMATSSSWPSAASSARVTIERSRFDHAGTRPDSSPGSLGDQVLKWPVEIGRRVLSPIDMAIAEN